MYSLLVSAALREDEAEERVPEAPGTLLHRLLEHRSQLASIDPGGEPRGPLSHADPATEMAAQVRYDVTLMHLCAVLGIEHDPAAFARPSVERRRLESALHQRGIDLDGL